MLCSSGFAGPCRLPSSHIGIPNPSVDQEFMLADATFSNKKIPVQVRKKSRSVNLLGCSSTLKGLSSRPVLNHGKQVMQMVHEFFCTKSGVIRTMDRVMNFPKVVPPEHPQNYDTPFNERSKLIRNAVRIFSTSAE